MKLDHLYQERLETNIVPKKTRSTNWWYFRASGKKWLHAFAWSPVLERLCMHPRLWPIILELFDGAKKIIFHSSVIFCLRLSRACLGKYSRFTKRGWLVLRRQAQAGGCEWHDVVGRCGVNETHMPCLAPFPSVEDRSVAKTSSGRTQRKLSKDRHFPQDTAAAGVSDPAAPSGAHGVRLHCSRESAGWDSHTAIFDVHHGR